MVEFRSNDPYRDTVREMFQAQARNMALTKSEPEKNRCVFFFFCCVQPHALQNYIDLHGLKSFSKEL